VTHYIEFRIKEKGYEMQDVNVTGTSSASIPYLFLTGFSADLLYWAGGERRDKN